MASINKVILIGNLGADPEVRQFPNGGSVTHINIATSERWTDKNTGEPKEQTEWHRVSLFNRLGEIAAQYLRKGSSVYIEGSLHTRKWQDQQTGQDRYTTEIRANQMQMLGGRGGDNYENGYNRQPTQGYQPQGTYPNAQQNQAQYQPQGNTYHANQQTGTHYPQQNQAQYGGYQGYQNSPTQQPYADDMSNTALGGQQSAQTSAMTASVGSGNQFAQKPVSPTQTATKGQPKAIVPPDTIADDDMPF